MKSKKAQYDYLKVIVIMGVTIILVFMLINRFRTEVSEETRLQLCKTSVSAHARVKVHNLDFSKNIRCPTKELTIPDKDESDIKRKLANELVECWDIFGKGELDLFSDEAVYCAICSRIDFEEKDKTIDGFSEYLLKTKMPNPNDDLSYADYLANFKTPLADVYAEDILSKSGEQTPIDTSKNYSTLFVYAKGKDPITDLKDAVGGTGQAVALTSVAGGAAGGTVAVLLLGSNPIGWTTVGAIALGAAASALYTYFAGQPPVWMALTTLTEYSKEELDRYNCKYLPIEQK